MRIEREQTDASLRVEREKVDDMLDEELSAVEEMADAVIALARARADEVLASARRKAATERIPTPTVERESVCEDDVLEQERARADEIVRDERAEKVTQLSAEREETDADLRRERERADHALATRDQFVGVVGHDLRNMVSTVIGFAALIEHRVTQDNQHVDQVLLSHARRIKRSGARMNRLVGDLVDVAITENGMLAVARELGDPAQVVTEAVDTFSAQASARSVSVVAEIVPPLSPVPFDAARILQVLCNLLTNAIKFTPAGGSIVLRVERIADELQFSVRDTGAGIPADKLELVFERFLQVTPNDRHGGGLGLYTAKCIVQGHGGRIWAESRMGEGSAFCFALHVEIVAV